MFIKTRCDTRSGWRVAVLHRHDASPRVPEHCDGLEPEGASQGVDVGDFRLDGHVFGRDPSARSTPTALVVVDEPGLVREPIQLRPQIGVVEVRAAVQHDDRPTRADLAYEELVDTHRVQGSPSWHQWARAASWR